MKRFVTFFSSLFKDLIWFFVEYGASAVYHNKISFVRSERGSYHTHTWKSVMVVKHLKSRTRSPVAPEQDDNTIRKQFKIQYKTQKSFVRKDIAAIK